MRADIKYTTFSHVLFLRADFYFNLISFLSFMGKSKSSRRQNRRHDPVTGTGSEGRNGKAPKKKETDPDSAAVLEAVLGQVTSEDSSNRSTGLTSLSIIASQKQHLTVLKNPTVLKAIVPLLLDSVLQEAAAGTLRNLSSVDSELCGMLVEENIMEKVVEIVRDTFATWMPLQTSGLKEETLVQCVALLWNLCESTPSAVQLATQNNLHSSLARYLDWNVFGIRLAATVAHCLYTLTEDNKNLAQTQQLAHALVILLQSPTTPSQLSTPALGTLLNISSDDFTKLPQEVQDSFFQLISNAMEPNFIDLINKLSSDLPISLEFNVTNEKNAEEINTVLATGKTALEILSNVICTDDDSSDAASDTSDAMDCDEEIQAPTSTLPIHLFATLSAQLPTLLPLILRACRPIPVNVHGILVSNKLQRLLNNLNQIRVTGLISLQNLFESLPLDVVEKAAPTGEILSALLKLLQNVEPIETDILESLTSSIRSLLTLWSSEKKKVQDLTVVVPPFLELYQKSTVDRIQINAIKILGSVCLLSNDLTLLKETGLFMKQVLSSGPVTKTNLLVIVELVDTLMDIFAEDDCDGVLGEIGLLGRLKSLTGEIKKVSRNERRSLAMEQKAVVQTVLDNVPRFVEYKSKIIKS